MSFEIGGRVFKPSCLIGVLGLKMADSEILDHQPELMRKWSNDKALMAQVGLLQAEALVSCMHLGHGRARGSANVGQHLHYQQLAVKGL